MSNPSNSLTIPLAMRCRPKKKPVISNSEITEELRYRTNWVKFCEKRLGLERLIAYRKDEISLWNTKLHNASLRLNQWKQKHWITE